MSELIYLGSPYSSKNPDKTKKLLEEESNYQQILQLTSLLMNKGLHVFSPIVHCHPMAVKYSLPTNWEYWKDYLHVMLPRCDKFWIAKMKGWQLSTGVCGEFDLANYKCIPVSLVSMKGEILFDDDASRISNLIQAEKWISIDKGL